MAARKSSWSRTIWIVMFVPKLDQDTQDSKCDSIDIQFDVHKKVQIGEILTFESTLEK